MDHAIELRHLLVQVGDDRERDLNAEILLDVAYPGNVRVNAVNAHADRLDLALLEVCATAGELYELRGAYRREVGRMAEEQHPVALAGVITQLDGAMRGLGLELWRLLQNTWDASC